MRFRELRILADENVSPKVVAFLRDQGLDVLDAKEQGWHGKSDDELLQIARRESRWILTHDADFGMLAVLEGAPHSGILFLRVKNLQSHNVVGVCSRLVHSDLDFPPQSLVVIEEGRIRLRRSSSERRRDSG
ncbi:DUF5615 family PIN-like protein [Candidatus Sumerlaeota bacterium]|nr:DUF5615 family PIN-like protein [Candidatus Sumerlaeota bacterium]